MNIIWYYETLIKKDQHKYIYFLCSSWVKNQVLQVCPISLDLRNLNLYSAKKESAYFESLMSVVHWHAASEAYWCEISHWHWKNIKTAWLQIYLLPAVMWKKWCVWICNMRIVDCLWKNHWTGTIFSTSWWPWHDTVLPSTINIFWGFSWQGVVFVRGSPSPYQKNFSPFLHPPKAP